jgi:catechol 2,3-dioxygenase-like lactoylglutathione lyase family enzyme
VSLTRESTEDTGAALGWDHQPVAIESLDLLYVPTRDAAADLRFYRDVLGGRVVFAIEAMGTRVAEVALGEGGPRLVLAEHLHGEAPVLLHRVESLDETLAELRDRGLDPERRVELPLGPAATFRSPGGQRLGLYELTRPGVTEAWAGRADFGG